LRAKSRRASFGDGGAEKWLISGRSSLETRNKLVSERYKMRQATTKTVKSVEEDCKTAGVSCGLQHP
jgi:hypothetical protein